MGEIGAQGGRASRPRATAEANHGVLYHESDLDPEEHYTDTHGYTEINFAAIGMVRMRFCSRASAACTASGAYGLFAGGG